MHNCPRGRDALTGGDPFIKGTGKLMLSGLKVALARDSGRVNGAGQPVVDLGNSPNGSVAVGIVVRHRMGSLIHSAR